MTYIDLWRIWERYAFPSQQKYNELLRHKETADFKLIVYLFTNHKLWWINQMAKVLKSTLRLTYSGVLECPLDVDSRLPYYLLLEWPLDSELSVPLELLRIVKSTYSSRIWWDIWWPVLICRLEPLLRWRNPLLDKSLSKSLRLSVGIHFLRVFHGTSITLNIECKSILKVKGNIVW